MRRLYLYRKRRDERVQLRANGKRVSWPSSALARAEGFFRVAPPITATISNSVKDVRGSQTRCVLPRVSGGVRKKPSESSSPILFSDRPSNASPSFKRRRSQRPSPRGRPEKLLRTSFSGLSSSPELKSLTKHAHLTS